MIRFIISCCLVLSCGSAALADPPKPIRLWLTPTKSPSPPLRYQLLADARILTPGDAGPIYKEAALLIDKSLLGQRTEQFSTWTEMPLRQLPKEEMRKELADYEEIYRLLDKAARCGHCDWGILELLRKEGFSAALPAIQQMRTCAQLLAVRARLEIAEGKFDAALVTLRNGFALARNIGESEVLISCLVGLAVAAIMEKQLDELIAQPNGPNLYYALTNLPTPLISMRKALEGERVGMYATLPGLYDVMIDLNAGNIPEEQLKKYGKIIGAFSQTDSALSFAERIVIGRNIQNRHELAKKALIEAGRPRDKVEAMPHLQVAILHAMLEFDAVQDNMIVWQSLPYWEYVQRMPKLERLTLERVMDPNKPAIPLASLFSAAIQKVTFSRARNDRKIALLRVIEAIRLHAATHDGKLPASLADIKEVPIPVDPVSGKSFEYQVNDETARLHAPPPGKEAPNERNSVVYELRIRK